MTNGLFGYGRMIADIGRTAAYADALRRHVTPESVVVDIGTGTGVFALLAARLGARKVYAIEADDAIDPVGSDYVYSWDTTVRSLDGVAKANFVQSDFLGQVLSADRLRKQSSGFTPTLSEDGHIDRAILTGAASGLALEQIARAVSAAFPHRFPEWTDAQRRVNEVSCKYCE
jgi:Ribosomal protein L11 methyltransferase (PrmA)